MVKRIIQLEGDVVNKLFKVYRQYGYPYGKNRRKRKKWLSKYCEYILRQVMNDNELDNSL